MHWGNKKWSRIGENKWVCADYLTDSNIKSTVGQVRYFRSGTTIYSNSNLTGSKYDYKANTSIIILQNISNTIDKVKVRQTGRTGYVNINVYK